MSSAKFGIVNPILLGTLDREQRDDPATV